jgi:hypothetical protein
MPRKLERKLRRTHIALFEDQEDRLRRVLPQEVSVAHLIRMLVDNYIDKLDKKLEEKQHVTGPVARLDSSGEYSDPLGGAFSQGPDEDNEG